MIKPDVIMITNSPGELSSWVRVLSRSLKEKRSDLRIIVMLVPCPYASGKEAKVAADLPGVDVVVSPFDFIKFSLLGISPRGLKFSPEGAVLFLGGDFWHAVTVAKRLKYSAFAYVAGVWAAFTDVFRCFFCPNQYVYNGLIAKGVPEEKLMLSGNLIVDGVKVEGGRKESLERWGLNPDRLTVGILPGSRLYNMQDSLPVLLRAADEIREAEPNIQFLLGVSPFINMAEIEDTVTNPRSPIPGARGRIISGQCAPLIQTEKGAQVLVMEKAQHQLMNMADIILTIPGTNTAECACLGKPMVVILSWKARVPSGFPGFLINLLPLGGLRRSLMYKILNKFKYSALPNIMAKEFIVPEVVVEDEVGEITGKVLKLIRDPQRRKEIGEKLQKIMGGSGAAEKITEVVLNSISPQEANIDELS